jgi:hypothetical protein
VQAPPNAPRYYAADVYFPIAFNSSWESFLAVPMAVSGSTHGVAQGVDLRGTAWKIFKRGFSVRIRMNRW